MCCIGTTDVFPRLIYAMLRFIGGSSAQFYGTSSPAMSPAMSPAASPYQDTRVSLRAAMLIAQRCCVVECII